MSRKEKIARRLCEMDFLQGADNVYRTPDFIVKQKISISVNHQGDAHSVSIDTYYARTEKRDADYEFAFQFRDKIDGKRIKSGTYLRQYVE